MRLSAAFIAIALSIPTAAADNPHQLYRDNPHEPNTASVDPRCSSTRPYVADMHGVYRGQKLTPKKLTELPPATGYMAVYRHIGPCEAPLTMVEYRSQRRR